jgi:hypothetical protein
VQIRDTALRRERDALQRARAAAEGGAVSEQEAPLSTLPQRAKPLQLAALGETSETARQIRARFLGPTAAVPLAAPGGGGGGGVTAAATAATGSDTLNMSCVSYFRPKVDRRREAPLSSVRADTYKRLCSVLHELYRDDRWPKEDEELLLREVKNLRKETLQEAVVRDPAFAAARSGAGGGIVDREAVREMGRALESLSRLSDAELLDFDVDTFEWSTIARRIEGQHTAQACKAHWRHFISPQVKRGKWTPVEENQLRVLVKTHPGQTWAWYAEKLGAGRTPLQCLLHFQRSINPDLLRKRWTAEEDTGLVRAVQAHGDRHWLAVSRDMDKRNAAQCMARWDKVLDPENGKMEEKAGIRLPAPGKRGPEPIFPKNLRPGSLEKRTLDHGGTGKAYACG